ncbi:MAG: bifunctional 4-hydroxy-2-oxoglutarate aldolase/2-dehydro-3-deoxy-phosphogluconate aldolase [Clostridiales bacterium]|nr:bifunctional 4-hydroxy-2-oxoglutarate aldolase/2-dehydro-3-deoxy-phosphogluconate aldolase [Clostridiales bacterium]
MKNQVIECIDRHKIIAIVRGLKKDQILPTAQALYDGGIRLMEVTFDQTGKIPASETQAMISAIAKEFEGKICPGAGTVMNAEQVRLAAEAGAQYIISPDTNEEVIKESVKLGLVSIPGALTPTEAAFAHRCGADYVKMFPAGELGLSYIKAVRAPLSHIKMLAVGGVDEKNLMDFIGAGLCGVGIGSGIVKKSLIDAGEYEKLTQLARAYTDQI